MDWTEDTPATCDKCHCDLRDYQIENAVCVLTGETISLCDTCYDMLLPTLVEAVV